MGAREGMTGGVIPSVRGVSVGVGWVASGVRWAWPLGFSFSDFLLLANLFFFYFFYSTICFDKTFWPKLFYKTLTNFWNILPYFSKAK